VNLTRRLLIVAILAAPLAGVGPGASAQLLNSERIEQTFGSYGIDVVYSDERLRLSNLYSLDEGRKIMRTFAIVGYPDAVERSFASEHAAIVAGGSIGATFKASGWNVVKTGHQYFEIMLPDALAKAMHVEPGTQAAADAYRLAIERRGKHFDYALIIEIHHPDYLSQADLESIYGAETLVGMPDSTRELLGAARRKLQTLALAFGE
jgi:hypothetical protein